MDSPDWYRSRGGLSRILGAKWSLHVLYVLESGSYGFNELKRELDDVTATVLSRRLKELRCHGLVSREVVEATPPRTAYRLTDAGEAVANRLGEIEALLSMTDDGSPDGIDCGAGANRPARCATETEHHCVTFSTSSAQTSPKSGCHH